MLDFPDAEWNKFRTFAADCRRHAPACIINKETEVQVEQLDFCNSREAAARMDRWGGRGESFFFMISYDGTECLVERELPPGLLAFSFPHAGNVPGEVVPFRGKLEWETSPMSFDDYLSSFHIVYRNLHAGNTFLTNLTCATRVKTNLSLDELFRYAHAPYRLWLKDRFVVFSPETFVRIEQGRIYSCPMKGTINAALPQAARTLLSDEKEAAEHATITDLIRNDLSQVAEHVSVSRYRYLDEVPTHSGRLLQMSSEICGELPEGFRCSLGQLFFRLLPAGSITGAPKRKTMEIIREAETYRRGFYTGVMGYYDGQNLDSAVMIRFVEQGEDGNLIFKSGGGITYRSDARKEYEEMKEKVYVPVY